MKPSCENRCHSRGDSSDGICFSRRSNNFGRYFSRIFQRTHKLYWQAPTNHLPESFLDLQKIATDIFCNDYFQRNHFSFVSGRKDFQNLQPIKL